MMRNNSDEVNELFVKIADMCDGVNVSHIWRAIAQIIIATDYNTHIQLDDNYEAFNEYIEFLKNYRESVVKDLEKRNDE
jgi:hypothetical protein